MGLDLLTYGTVYTIGGGSIENTTCATLDGSGSDADVGITASLLAPDRS